MAKTGFSFGSSNIKRATVWNTKPWTTQQIDNEIYSQQQQQQIQMNRTSFIKTSLTPQIFKPMKPSMINPRLMMTSKYYQSTLRNKSLLQQNIQGIKVERLQGIPKGEQQSRQQGALFGNTKLKSGTHNNTSGDTTMRKVPPFPPGIILNEPKPFSPSLSSSDIPISYSPHTEEASYRHYDNQSFRNSQQVKYTKAHMILNSDIPQIQTYNPYKNHPRDTQQYSSQVAFAPKTPAFADHAKIVGSQTYLAVPAQFGKMPQSSSHSINKYLWNHQPPPQGFRLSNSNLNIAFGLQENHKFNRTVILKMSQVQMGQNIAQRYN